MATVERFKDRHNKLWTTTHQAKDRKRSVEPVQCVWSTSAVQGGFGGAEDLRKTRAHIQVSQGELIHEVWQLL